MHSRTLILCGCILWAGAAIKAPHAEGIYKCIDDAPATPQSTTTYQSKPCANGQVETQIVAGVTKAKEEPPAKAAAQLPREETPKSGAQGRREEPSKPVRSSLLSASERTAWPFRRVLTIGMSDDEVLNLPGWGRPTQIIRTKVPREWREEWVYVRPSSDERHLHFVNAALVEISDQPPPDRSPPLDRLASN